MPVLFEVYPSGMAANALLFTSSKLARLFPLVLVKVRSILIRSLRSYLEIVAAKLVRSYNAKAFQLGHLDWLDRKNGAKKGSAMSNGVRSSLATCENL